MQDAGSNWIGCKIIFILQEQTVVKKRWIFSPCYLASWGRVKIKTQIFLKPNMNLHCAVVFGKEVEGEKERVKERYHPLNCSFCNWSLDTLKGIYWPFPPFFMQMKAVGSEQIINPASMQYEHRFHNPFEIEDLGCHFFVTFQSQRIISSFSSLWNP